MPSVLQAYGHQGTCTLQWLWYMEVSVENKEKSHGMYTLIAGHEKLGKKKKEETPA